jgi:transposase
MAFAGGVFIAGYILADKGYDPDAFIQAINDTGAIAVIPPRKNRFKPRDYDKVIYKDRNLVERLFQKLKDFLWIATRNERQKRNYQAMLDLAVIVIWLN